MTFLRALIAAFALILGAAPALADTVVLNRGNGAEPDTLDPQKATGQWENNIIGDMLMGLMTEDAKGNPINGMAESYTTSEDGLVWTFKLRPDAVWSDGEPVTAEDFVYAYQRINNAATASQYASLTHIIKNADKVLRGEVPPDQIGAKAIDAKTLELTLEHPAPYLPYQLMHYAMYPVPKHTIDKVGEAWVQPGNYVSNGPFVLVEWRPNAYVKVKKNPKFFDAANVKIDEMTYSSSEDLVTAVKRFRAGEFDLSQGVPGQMIDELKKTMPDELRISDYMSTFYIVFNLTRDPWKDERIRNALGLAMDREVVVEKILRAGEAPAYELVPKTIPNYPHTAILNYAGMTMPERIEKAKALLAEAGYGPDNPLRVTFLHQQSTDAKRIAAALQSMWKAIGVQMTPQGTETKIAYNSMRTQDYDVALAGWIADFPDASNYLYLAKTSSEEMNYSKYSNAAFDQLNIDGDSELDAVKRGDLLNKAEQLMLDEAPMVPLYHAVSRNLVATYVKGWENSITNIHRTRWISIEGPRKSPGVVAAKDGGDGATVAADSQSDRPWYWWIVAIWEWFKGLLCSWFGIACPSA